MSADTENVGLSTWVFKKLGIPKWGQLLYAFVAGASLACFGFLWVLNRDVGRVEGKIDSIPVKFSLTVLEESQVALRLGNEPKAEKGLVLVSALISSASIRKIPAQQQDLVVIGQGLNRLEATSKSEKFQKQAHDVLMEVVDYKSVLTPLPGGRPAKIQKVYATNVLKPEPNKPSIVIPGDDALDGSGLPEGQDFLALAYPLGSGFVRVATPWYIGGAQTLDNIQWVKVTFEGTHIKYRGGSLDLHEARFVNCTFEITNNEAGNEMVAGLLKGQTTFTHGVAPPLYFQGN